MTAAQRGSWRRLKKLLLKRCVYAHGLCVTRGSLQQILLYSPEQLARGVKPEHRFHSPLFTVGVSEVRITRRHRCRSRCGAQNTAQITKRGSLIVSVCGFALPQGHCMRCSISTGVGGAQYYWCDKKSIVGFAVVPAVCLLRSLSLYGPLMIS